MPIRLSTHSPKRTPAAKAGKRRPAAPKPQAKTTPAQPKDEFRPAQKPRKNQPSLSPQAPLAASSLMGVEPASSKLLDGMRKHGRTIDIAQPGSEEMRYLDYMGAEANVGGPHLENILLRAQPSKVAILEEFLHGTQSKLKMLDKHGRQACEVKVKEFMIRHASMLGIGAADVAILEKLLAEEKKLLAASQGGGR